MKRRFLLIAIVLWILVTVTVISAIIFGVNGGFNISNHSTIIKEENILLGNIQNIVVESSYQDLEIRKTNSDSIKVSQYGSSKTRSEKLFLVSASDDSVKIYFNSTWDFNLFSFNYNEKLVIEIPEDFIANLKADVSSGGLKVEDEFTLKTVSLKNSSGGIYINKNLTADTINVNTSSGGIHVEGNITSSEDLTVNSSSGGIKINSTIIAKKFEAKSSSGGISLDTLDAESYYLKNSSGNIKANSISGSGEAKTTSGSIQLSLKNPKGSINLNTSSGGIKIMLEPELQFTLDAQTSSGNVRTNFATDENEKGNKVTAKIGNNPTVSILARASSGGIRVEQ